MSVSGLAVVHLFLVRKEMKTREWSTFERIPTHVRRVPSPYTRSCMQITSSVWCSAMLLHAAYFRTRYARLVVQEVSSSQRDRGWHEYMGKPY